MPDRVGPPGLNEHPDDLPVAVADMAAHRRRPPMDVDDVIDALARAGLINLVATFRELSTGSTWPQKAKGLAGNG
jgi:hypothetical protein